MSLDAVTLWLSSKKNKTIRTKEKWSNLLSLVQKNKLQLNGGFLPPKVKKEHIFTGHIFTNQVIFIQSRHRHSWSDHTIWLPVAEGDDLWCGRNGVCIQSRSHTRDPPTWRVQLWTLLCMWCFAPWSPHANISGWIDHYCTRSGTWWPDNAGLHWLFVIVSEKKPLRLRRL